MPRTLICALLALLVPAPAAPAQTLLHDVLGADEGYGLSVAGGADLDLDGWDDFVVGSPLADVGGQVAGAVEVRSGRDGSLLHAWYGAGADDLFGLHVALAGDVDGDGAEDVIVGAPGAADPTGVRTGSAHVFSGRTGTVIYTVHGDVAGGRFGLVVGGGLDRDGDGRAEFVVSAFWAGLVRLFDGATGSIAGEIAGTPYVFGESLWARSDVDGDGVGDLVIGSPMGGATFQGQVQVVSGATLQTVWEVTWPVTGPGFNLARFGNSVSAGPDVDRDGRAEVIVGAPNDNTVATSAGFVGLFDGASGALVRSWYGSVPVERLGYSVAALGDVDGDSVGDLAFSAPHKAKPTVATVASGATGAVQFTLAGQAMGTGYGFAVADAGDVNRDGAPDLVLGAPFVVLGFPRGRVRVHSGVGPGIVNYCTAGTSASGCRAQIAAGGTPSATAPTGFALSAAGVEGNRTGMFLYGTGTRQVAPWGNGSSLLCVTPPSMLGGLQSGDGTAGACDGTFLQDLNARWCPTCPKPGHNFGPGAIVRAQLWYRDPGNTSGQTTSLSDAVEFVLGP